MQLQYGIFNKGNLTCLWTIHSDTLCQFCSYGDEIHGLEYLSWQISTTEPCPSSLFTFSYRQGLTKMLRLSLNPLCTRQPSHSWEPSGSGTCMIVMGLLPLHVCVCVCMCVVYENVQVDLLQRAEEDWVSFPISLCLVPLRWDLSLKLNLVAF